jgi:seryl-tRNA synthetase
MTKLLKVTLERPIPSDLRGEVDEKLAYAADRIRKHTLAVDGASVDVELDDDAVTDDVESHVRAIVDAMTGRHREVERIVVREHRRDTRYSAPIWNDLESGGLVALQGPGLAVLSSEAVDLVEALDRIVTDRARATFGARPTQYPTMIPMAALDRCHYFGSFPHHVTFPLHVRDDLAAIKDLASAEASRRDDFAGILEKPSHVLSPAVCFHAYTGLQDRALTAPAVITAKGRCFRYESRNFASLERLWDFTLREIIFVGPKAWVEEQRQAWVDETMVIVEQLELDAWVETANDPFFLNNFRAQRYFQLVSQTKYELRLSLPYAPGRSLAAASYNLHNDFFGASFGIRQAQHEGFANTACVGFGLERFAWALFAQHGPVVASWPARIRDALGLSTR